MVFPGGELEGEGGFFGTFFDRGFSFDADDLELCLHGDEWLICHFRELPQGEFIGACFDNVDVPRTGDFFKMVDLTKVPRWVAGFKIPVLGAEVGRVLGGIAEVEVKWGSCPGRRSPSRSGRGARSSFDNLGVLVGDIPVLPRNLLRGRRVFHRRGVSICL